MVHFGSFIVQDGSSQAQRSIAKCTEARVPAWLVFCRVAKEVSLFCVHLLLLRVKSKI